MEYISVHNSETIQQQRRSMRPVSLVPTTPLLVLRQVILLNVLAAQHLLECLNNLGDWAKLLETPPQLSALRARCEL
jgi:hypothetical protein